MMPTPIRELVLNQHELKDVNHLLNQILGDTEEIGLEELLSKCFVLSHRLPERIKQFVYDFKTTEHSPGILIRHPEPPFDVAFTPEFLVTHRRETVTRDEVLHILYATLVGYVIAWNSIQNGNLVNHVLPIRSHENKLLSSGSANKFELHTEDAFHPYAEEFLSLLCMRNPYKVSTDIAFLGDVELPEDVKELLFQPQFVIGANLAHTVNQPKDRRSILFGNRESPYFRLNLNMLNMDLLEQSAKDALDFFINGLKEVEQSVVLGAGDVLFLDNFRTAHGRPPYLPAYDGSDRWLKRLYITTDLRKSRDLRESAASRLIKTKTRR
ncbi:TauD/TfdA family dioxygenase [Leptolyngbya ohadii]|uniref:TauD/TfdA family dioxygenase n=1 Tax=Leptolyngbya ohadii TaxID=1962290 RepID=UPI000B59DEDF|nr:TauD/TfdA family dioxygenase [Leptolyngbya ohadii]